MENKASRLVSSFPKPRNTLVIPQLALRTVTSKTGQGVYASSDTLYKGAVFGRDSLDVAEDLLATRPKLAHAALRTLASLQGQTDNPINEEEPGKIVHEYRSVVVDGKPIDKASLAIFQNLSQKWGGNEREMAYYGSVDATPHFLRTLDRYCRLHGAGILNEKITLRHGGTVEMHVIAQRAGNWLLQKLIDSKTGLVEYQRRNPHGILNQVWKDSDEFYVHENGERANHDSPIASIEVQGLAYDGLLALARMQPSHAASYRQTAAILRNKTIDLLWQPKRNYFGLGLDHDFAGKRRVIATHTANPAALLDSGFFDELPPEQYEHYVSALTEKIMSYEFLTDAGIRSRALSAGNLVNFWDYHGSFVSWPKETFDIAKGLERHGFPALARQLENRLLNIVLKHRQYPEFVYVDGWGRVLSSTPTEHSHGEITIVEGSNNPEKIQAWTVSAVLAIVSKRAKNKIKRTATNRSNDWKSELETTILQRIPRINRHLNPFRLQAKYPTNRYRLKR